MASKGANAVKQKNKEFKKLNLFPDKACKWEINCGTKCGNAGEKEE